MDQVLKLGFRIKYKKININNNNNISLIIDPILTKLYVSVIYNNIKLGMSWANFILVGVVDEV